MAVLTAFVVVFLVFSGAAFAQEPAGKLSVIATNFPGFDFARRVAGDAADVAMLLPPGAESHTYEPTPRDILKIQNCDLFIYVGGHNDTWVDDVLSSIDHEVPVLRMMECVTTVPDETIEGMTEDEHHLDHEGEEAHEGEESHEHEGEEAHEHEGEESHEDEESHEHNHDDEHVWTSPKNAITIERAIADKLAALDPANAAAYYASSEAYTAELAALDAQFTEFFGNVSSKTFIVGDRFPLRYFTEAYGLTYYAAFPGCSTETEPSAATIAFLIDKVTTEKVSTVFYIEFSNHLVADSIAEQTGARAALFHSCHNVSQADLDAGATYLKLMTGNLETLKGAMK